MRWSELERTALEAGMTLSEMRQHRSLSALRLAIDLHRQKG